jgi:predicted aspartyl protease
MHHRAGILRISRHSSPSKNDYSGRRKMATLRLLIVALSWLFEIPVAMATHTAAEINLGFRLSAGTYTVQVAFPEIGTRNLTFDTGASFTVLDRKDVVKIPGAEITRSRLGIYLQHEGKAIPAQFAVIPSMKIGGCTLRKSNVMVIDIPGGRQGVIGMNDLESLAPFTFTRNGKLQFQCPGSHHDAEADGPDFGGAL